MKRRTAVKYRHLIQLLAAVIMNGYAAGFVGKKIFQGPTKMFCVPVLNCYSCPGALGSCPIGAMQAVIGRNHGRFPFYVLGTLMLFGVLLGRLVCGFICPFGFIQDLLNRIPHPRVTVPRVIDRPLRFVKYAVLIVFVILLPALAGPAVGPNPPWFCQYICPAGALEGGLTLVLADPQLRGLIGWLFDWKVAVLIAVVVGAVFIPRFFCRYLCPLGAFYAVFNRFSLYHMELDRSLCIGCGACEKACPMAVEVRKNTNSPECIRCGECRRACPTGAICAGFSKDPQIKQRQQAPSDARSKNSSPQD